MEPDTVVGAVVVGLVVGVLGRLVLPGRQPIGCLLTILIGVVGAIAGAAVARSADVTWWPLVLLLQVAVAAVGVGVVAAAMRRPRRRRR